MKDFLIKLIARKKEELEGMKKRMKESTDATEVRALGDYLIALKDEIIDAENQLNALEDTPNPTGEEEGRSLDPKKTLGTFTVKETRTAADEDTRASMEYRTAFMNYAQRGVMSSVLEHRADDQNESTDLGVLLPTTIVQEIIKGVEKERGQLYSRVKKTNIKGGVKYPIGSFSATFTRIGENGAPTDRQNGGAVTGYVEFTYKIGEIRLAQTLLANILSVPVFEQELAKVIVEAYVEAIEKEIISGVAANNQCEGILTEAAKATGSRIINGNIIEFNDNEIVDWKKWQTKLFAKIPLSMRGLRPQFVLTANTYEANIKTLVDDNNRPVYNETFNPVDGTENATFKGKEVVFVEEDILENYNDASAGDFFGIYWVPEKAYAINTNLEFAVKRYFDEEKLQYVDRAVVINDGKILDPKYLYLLKKVAVPIS